MREHEGASILHNSGALNINPRWVIFPPAIRGPILTACRAPAVTTTGNPGEKNIWEGQMDPVEDAELGRRRGGSDTAHYLAADTRTSTRVEYAYLEGLDAAR
jgi:hypothetical protein